MATTPPQKSEIQEKHRNSVGKDGVKAYLLSLGVSAAEAEVLTESVLDASQSAPKQEDGVYKNYVDKTLVYEDKDAYIYKRGDTKSGIWYFRIYDTKNRKPVFKSLKTTDKTTAIQKAKVWYIEIKGKLERGERLKQINTQELVDMWLEKMEKTITPIPHEGLTPGSFKNKKYFMKCWLDYMRDELHMINLPIDKIKPVATRDFGKWMMLKPKETALHTGKKRSAEKVNDTISEIIRMYHQLAVREKYISVDGIPQIDRIKYKVNDAFKRDIFRDLQQYNDYVFYLKRNYITKKHNPGLCISKKGLKELECRKIFSEFTLILANAGFRPKELLGIKYKEIYSSPSFNEEEAKDNVVMVVRRDNSKTGKERRVVAPVKKRIDRIVAAYKKLGITHEPEDFLFINPLSPTRKSYGRMIMYQRLKKTLVASGLQEEMDKEGRNITPYSFRHYYAYLRLINGVSIHLLAQNLGTSIQKIESTYGHINTEIHAGEITKGQGIIKNTETRLETYPTVDF